ncbi:DUF2798 domain-containing protein [Serratia marcescens]|uniref:DUF2798 domain-containing protein n=1 Tax=Serratia marcescens TaxID=615 RepID=UPI0032EC0B72
MAITISFIISGYMSLIHYDVNIENNFFSFWMNNWKFPLMGAVILANLLGPLVHRLVAFISCKFSSRKEYQASNNK